MYISPMLLQQADKPFDNNEWITEIKFDGIRLTLSKFNDKVRLYTRHHNEVTSKFPELLNLNIPNGTILDGELIVAGEDGKPDFEAVMKRFLSPKADIPIQYVVFDIVYHNGNKVRLPLIERKGLLEKVIPEDNYNIVLSKWFNGNAVSLFELVKEQKLEGIVQKKADSSYRIPRNSASSIRSKDWLKIINYSYETCFITGITKDKPGVLLSSINGKPLGVMEFMPPAAKRVLYNHLETSRTEENAKYIYMDQKLKCKVKYRNYTKTGKLRIPSFVEWVS